jgi:DNA-binding GntR family transcriptional regulator
LEEESYEVKGEDQVKTEKRRTTKTIVFERLRGEILDGTFKPGEQLRQEAIARRYGVSLTPVREALMQLEIEGLVTFYPNSGATVSTLMPAEIRELYEIRFLLESGALKYAARSLTKEHILKARNILAELREETDPGEWCRKDVDFHLALCEAAKKPKLLDFIRMVHTNVSRYLRLYFDTEGVQLSKSICDDHSALLKAVEDGEVGKAIQILDSHLSEGGRRLYDFMLTQE